MQPSFSNNILQNMWDQDMLLSKVTEYSISGNTLTVPAVDETSRADGSRAGGVRSYWTAEAGEITASQPKFRELNLKVNKLAVLIYATEELLEDVGSLNAFIGKVGPEEIKFRIADALLNGSGAGQPLGILNSACLVSVAKESGQAAVSIVHQNILKMYSRLHISNPESVCWIVNRDATPQLYALASDSGSTNPIFIPEGGLSEKPYATLMGFPVVFSEVSATMGTVGDIILADVSGYIAADKGGIKSAVPLHVRFIYDEQVFKFTYRFDGQPALASSITPFKGSNTVSNFVALATRS